MIRQEGAERGVGDAAEAGHTAGRPEDYRGAEEAKHGQLAGLEGKADDDGLLGTQAGDQEAQATGLQKNKTGRKNEVVK